MKKNKKHYDKYKKFDVVYADFGRNPHGVQGGIRPGIVVSCDASDLSGIGADFTKPICRITAPPFITSLFCPVGFILSLQI